MFSKKFKSNIKRVGSGVSNMFTNFKKGLAIAPMVIQKGYQIANLGNKILPQNQQNTTKEKINKIYDKSNQYVNQAKEVTDFIDKSISILHN